MLRGPASVMYGEGAIGGAINVISKMPLWVPRNQAEVSLDSNMTRRIAVDSGGPVNKDVAYRITATGNMSDGWVDRDKHFECRAACRGADAGRTKTSPGRCRPTTATAARRATSARR